MNNSEIEGLEYRLEENKAKRDIRDKAVRLAKVPEFKELILDEFCRDYCAHQVHLSTDPRLDQKIRDDALVTAQAAGALKRFLSFLVQEGATADNQIEEIEEMLAHARASEDTPVEFEDVDGDGYPLHSSKEPN